MSSIDWLRVCCHPAIGLKWRHLQDWLTPSSWHCASIGQYYPCPTWRWLDYALGSMTCCVCCHFGLPSLFCGARVVLTSLRLWQGCWSRSLFSRMGIFCICLPLCLPVKLSFRAFWLPVRHKFGKNCAIDKYFATHVKKLCYCDLKKMYLLLSIVLFCVNIPIYLTIFKCPFFSEKIARNTIILMSGCTMRNLCACFFWH